MKSPGNKTSRRALLALLSLTAAAATVHAVTPATFDHIIVASDPGGEPLEKAIADINGDGKGDLIVGMGTAYGPGGIYWWQFPSSGDPHDAWTKHTIVSSGNCYEHSQIIDLNGDGRPDIVCSYNSNLVWFKHPGGDGTGTWTMQTITSGIGHEVRLADIDGDGVMDIVTSRTQNINFQNSGITWTTVPWGATTAGTPQDGMALLDIGSGLGAVNIVCDTSSGIYWLENPREHGGNARTDTWIAHLIASNDTGGCIFATMDVNGDGLMDIIQAPNEAAQGTQGLIWYQAPTDRRNGTWTKHTIDNTWQAVHWIAVADMNNDGHPDFIIEEQEQAHDPSGGPYNYNNDRVAIYYSDGAGNLTEQLLETTGGQNEAVGDIDGNGWLDFFSCNHGVFGAPHPVELWMNRPPVNRYEAENLAVAAQTSGITYRDSTDTRFSNDEGTFFDATATNQFVTLAVPGVAAATYDVRVGIKAWNNKGVFQTLVSRLDSLGSATNLGSTVDEYNANETFTEVDLGNWSVSSTSDKAFKFNVTGKNASSAGYGLAFDYITLSQQSGSGGSLVGNVAAGSSSTYNLTSLGTRDWAHWNGTYIHKSSGGSQISNVTQVGAGNYGTFHDVNRNISWSDGTPTGTGTNDQNYIWCNDKQNAGWTFTVPADTTSRTLTVLFGGASGAVVSISAHLSDSSATDFSNTATITTDVLNSGTFTYHAASAGQTLTITLLKVADANGPSADLDAAYLQ